jgi:nucleoside-diphosphate-sugar epimerase
MERVDFADLVFNTDKPDGTMRKLTDVSNLHGLGWRHKTSLDEGLRKFYDWYQDSVPVKRGESPLCLDGRGLG